jgi:hypothetical protein
MNEKQFITAGVDVAADRVEIDITAWPATRAPYSARFIPCTCGAVEKDDCTCIKAAQVDSDAWRDAAADVLGKTSLLYRMLCQQAEEYSHKAPAPTAEPVAQHDTGNGPLSSRLRAGVECAPWVVDAVMKLEAAAQARAVPETWRPMDTAPRDGTMLRLLVQFEDHATEDTTEPAPTIGAYEEGADGWQFAGWCWSHDHFTEGKGEPVGWLPMVGGQVRELPEGWSITPEPNPLGGKNAMCLRDPSGRASVFGTFSEEVVARDFLAALLAAAPSPGEPSC